MMQSLHVLAPLRWLMQGVDALAETQHRQTRTHSHRHAHARRCLSLGRLAVPYGLVASGRRSFCVWSPPRKPPPAR
uniref:Putative secreted protein n=1 Tax=Ixodes ricinus TaxID=34613 RepID=A0A6B0U4C6_IXORI